MNREASCSVSYTPFMVLTVIFVILKLLDVIDWSWWWVFSPAIIGVIWVVLALVVIVWIIDD